MIEWLFLLLIVGNCLGSIPPQELSRIADPVPDVEFQSASESEGVQPICANRLIEPRPLASESDDRELAHPLPALGWDTSRNRREVIIPIHNEEARIGGRTTTINPSHFTIGESSCSHVDPEISASKKEDATHSVGQKFETNVECPICLTPFDPSSPDLPLPWDCGHRYDRDCLDSYLYLDKPRKTHRCPVCNAPLRRDGVPVEAPIDRPVGISEDMEIRRAIWQLQMNEITARERSRAVVQTANRSLSGWQSDFRISRSNPHLSECLYLYRIFLAMLSLIVLSFIFKYFFNYVGGQY
ncbi:hypothetical protein MJO28_000737 [Puccinia striiformis f. sp. tritici]|uniref:Uncharacterized protein n=1 Tax=Puccinia striiformis f. sp. tritici TaxID=168172 RepID=A0ACC0F0I8_9BASI|nr:hypothetical protein Pst134EB_001695 [Puccinia striiformis f. sp. tritici]KAI7962643.1 hypothetical protein MJO28_000737 [Puccinia striiformis f. sp. tritici]